MLNNTNKPATAPRRLRLGLIAASEELTWLSLALQRPTLELTAQAGMSKAEALPDVPWFDDTRVMLTQTPLDALILATAPRTAGELSRLAFEQRLNVWRPPPLARSFTEAVEIAAQARQAGIIYRVASWWTHIADDVRWALRLRENFRPIFSKLTVACPGPPVQSWRASQVDSGGGVLAGDAYALLETLIAVRGLPDGLFATIGKCRRLSSGPPRETEDVAAAILRYADGGIATLQATWDVQPFAYEVAHYGVEDALVLDDSRVSVHTNDDRVLDERAINPRQRTIELDLTHFEAAVRNVAPDSDAEARAATLAADAAELQRHLATCALLDTIYLAARTGQPESPRKHYEVHNWPEPAL